MLFIHVPPTPVCHLPPVVVFVASDTCEKRIKTL